MSKKERSAGTLFFLANSDLSLRLVDALHQRPLCLKGGHWIVPLSNCTINQDLQFAGGCAILHLDFVEQEGIAMKKTYLLAGTSILLWSTLATVSKLLLGTMNSVQVLAISAAFAFVVLFLYNLCTGALRVMKGYQLKDYLILVAIGLPGTLFYNLFYFAGATILPASQAFIVNYLWPIMSVVFACILLKEKLTGRKILAFAISFLGVATVAGGDLLNFQPQTLGGILLCMGAAVSYGVYTAVNQRWSYDKKIAVMIAYGSTGVLCLVIQLCMGMPLTMNWGQTAGLVWNGIGVMAVATTTWAMALDAGPTAKISNLAYITPFLSLVWTFLVLHEIPSLWAVAGLCLIVLGIFVQLKDKR